MTIDPLLTVFWLKALSRRAWALLLEDVETWPEDYRPAAEITGKPLVAATAMEAPTTKTIREHSEMFLSHYKPGSKPSAKRERASASSGSCPRSVTSRPSYSSRATWTHSQRASSSAA